jgi:hypothetical protein
MKKETYLDPFLRDTRVYKDIEMRQKMYRRFGENDSEEGIQAFLWGMSKVLSRGI